MVAEPRVNLHMYSIEISKSKHFCLCPRAQRSCAAKRRNLEDQQTRKNSETGTNHSKLSSRNQKANAGFSIRRWTCVCSHLTVRGLSGTVVMVPGGRDAGEKTTPAKAKRR